MSSSTAAPLKLQGYIHKAEWDDSGYIGKDKRHQFSEHITTVEGAKISIAEKDFYVCLATREWDFDPAINRVTLLELPSTLFYGKKEGDTIHYKWDGRATELTLTQQNFTKKYCMPENFEKVFLSLQNMLNAAEKCKPMLHQYCIDVPREGRYLLAFEERQWRITKGIVDFMELSREPARVYDPQNGDRKLEDGFASIHAMFPFEDGFAYKLRSNDEPFRSDEAVRKRVDFGRFEFRFLEKKEDGFTLCLTTLFGENEVELGVIYSENKSVILGKGKMANPRIFPYSKLGEQYYRYFQSFAEPIEVGSLSLHHEKGRLSFQGKFSYGYLLE